MSWLFCFEKGAYVWHYIYFEIEGNTCAIAAEEAAARALQASTAADTASTS